jgi:hypothetical protein
MPLTSSSRIALSDSIALSDMSHGRPSSLILSEVDPAGVAVLEFQRAAPRPI